MSGSENDPESLAGWNLESNTSIVAALKFVAYRKTPVEFVASASPLYTAPLPPSELSVSRIAALRSGCAGLPAEIAPSHAEKMNRAGVFGATLKAEPFVFRSRPSEAASVNPSRVCFAPGIL